MRLHVTALSLVALVALVALAACGSSDETPDRTSDETEKDPTDEQPKDPPDSGSDEGRAPLDCNDPDVLCYEFGPIDVEPGSEWQGFQAIPVNNDAPRAIVRIEVDQVGATSHHYIIAPWSGQEPPPLEGPYDLFGDQGGAFVGDVLGGIVAGSVYKYVDISTGDYIGVRIPEDAYLVNNGHFVNASGETDTGLTRVKIQTVPADDVEFLAVEDQPGQNQIEVPPGETRTVGSTWEPEQDVAVLLMTAHMHRHGTLFKVWSVIDGVEEQVYETDDYDSPPLQIFSGTSGSPPPLVLRPGRGDHLRFECTHVNDDLDVTLTYGPFADTSEMCIMPIYYVGNPDALLERVEESAGEGGFSWEYVPY